MLQRIRLFAISLLALFTIAMLEKGLFAIQHSELHQGQDLLELLGTLLWGFRFDLAISTILALLSYLGAQLIALLPSRNFVTALRWTTLSASIILILLHGADSLYYSEAGRHLGYELKEGLNSGTALAIAALTTYIIPVSGQLLIMLLALFWTGLLFKRLAPHPSAQPQKWHRLAAQLALLPLLLLSATLVRGGVQQIPLEPIQAQRIGNSSLATLALNGAYNALYASITSQAVSPLFATPANAQELTLVREMYHRDIPQPDANPQKRNVILLLLESWSGAYMAPYGYDKVTTPNFDRFRQQGLTTRAMLAGGSRTTEGMFATLCSAQNPLGKTVAQSQLQNYDYHCLPRVMREYGWSTAFFQGTYKDTSGTGSFAQLLGFEQSYGREDIDPATAQYPTHSWGYHDPDIYHFVLDKIRTLPQPFMVGINTDSTHSSELPPGVEAILPVDSALNRYLNVLHFADAALDQFIQTVRSEPGMEETIFVLVADHSGTTPPTPLQKHLIPFTILARDVAPLELNVIATQRDIAPTLMQLLGLPTPRNFSGVSLLQTGDNTHFADYYHQGILGWVEGNQSVEFPINDPQQIHCYSLQQHLNTNTPDACGENEVNMRARAIAFTHMSQSLLFAGKLSEFSPLH